MTAGLRTVDGTYFTFPHHLPVLTFTPLSISSSKTPEFPRKVSDGHSCINCRPFTLGSLFLSISVEPRAIFALIKDVGACYCACSYSAIFLSVFASQIP